MNYGFILKSGKIINNTATHRQISNLWSCLFTNTCASEEDHLPCIVSMYWKLARTEVLTAALLWTQSLLGCYPQTLTVININVQPLYLSLLDTSQKHKIHFETNSINIWKCKVFHSQHPSNQNKFIFIQGQKRRGEGDTSFSSWRSSSSHTANEELLTCAANQVLSANLILFQQ